jgi:hypothetical protein
MKSIAALVLASSALFCVAANAQYVKGNEAVKSAASGKKVELPPMPASVGKVCDATARCYAGAWRMVETDAGLMECTEPYARPGACRISSYGSQKLARVWVVKRNSEWVQCQYPDLASKCTPMFARPPANLPVDAVQ